VNLWAVPCPATTPCGGRDEVVKVTKHRQPHVRMLLIEPHRLQNQARPPIASNSLNDNKKCHELTVYWQTPLKNLGNIYGGNATKLTNQA
jgi:hypothetical protein